MSGRNFVGISLAVLAATVALVLVMNGLGEPGLRAAIRTTARTSALCVILALAGIRAREIQIVLPFSHAVHYAMIVALGIANSAAIVRVVRSRAARIAGTAIS